MSMGSWLLPTCDETRCGCVSPATLVPLLLFLGINELDSFPVWNLHNFIYSSTWPIELLHQLQAADVACTPTHPGGAGPRQGRINPATQRNAGQAPTPSGGVIQLALIHRLAGCFIDRGEGRDVGFPLGLS